MPITYNDDGKSLSFNKPMSETHFLKKKISSTLLNYPGQNSLLEDIQNFSASELSNFLSQLINWSPALLAEQQQLIRNKYENSSVLRPLTRYDVPHPDYLCVGKKQIIDGKVACLILAGGQGSRLKINLPKALVPITLIRKKTLLQFLCEKIKAASSVFGQPLSVAIMTSIQSYTLIQNYLQEQQFFGLSPSQVYLFTQQNTPFLNMKGCWFLDKSGSLAQGPNGNGYAFHDLFSSGIGLEWKKKGIQSVMVIPIDNPLADPFDCYLCGYQKMYNKDVAVKAILKKDPKEHLGAFIEKEGKIGIQEYSELPSDCFFPLAHIGNFCFSFESIQQMIQNDLPWHVAQKLYQEKLVYKFEKFLFDLLDYSSNTGVLVYPRENVYAPLKNAEGEHCLKSVQQSLLNFDRQQIQASQIFQLPPFFELEPVFYYQFLYNPNVSKKLLSSYIILKPIA